MQGLYWFLCQSPVDEVMAEVWLLRSKYNMSRVWFLLFTYVLGELKYSRSHRLNLQNLMLQTQKKAIRSMGCAQCVPDAHHSWYLLQENRGKPVGSHQNHTVQRSAHREHLQFFSCPNHRQEARGGAGEEVEVREEDAAASCWLSVLCVQSRGGLKRCVAAFTQAREAQTRKHPERSL